MRILGIDPGIGRCGWAIVEENNGKIKSVAYDCLETDSKEETVKRLEKVFNEMERIIAEFKPQALSIEELFFAKNAKTAFIVGQARGVILLAAARKNLPVFVYTPLQVKMSVTGYGKAQKDQIGKMVKALLLLKEIPKPDDTADALAVALTHAFSLKLLKYSK